MKCRMCEMAKAEYLLFSNHDHTITPVCDDCLQVLYDQRREENLTYRVITDLPAILNITENRFKRYRLKLMQLHKQELKHRRRIKKIEKLAEEMAVACRQLQGETTENKVWREFVKYTIKLYETTKGVVLPSLKTMEKEVSE